MKQFYFVCTILLLLCASNASAQFYKGGRTLEYSSLFKRYYYKEPFILQVGVGQSLVFGDYCSRLNCMSPGLSINAGGYMNLQPGISVGAEMDYFRLGARQDDPEIADTDRISFQSHNIALAGIIKINLLKDKSLRMGQTPSQSPAVMPYLRFGIGGLLYQPVSYRNGEQVDTRHPEEPIQKYPGIALTLPVGAGVSFKFMYRIRINAEFTYHFTNTDYLDDMGAAPGTRSSFDKFSIAAIKVQYAL